MSTANDALKEYINHAEHPRTGEVTHAFMAGALWAFRYAAERIDRGPQIPLPPSIYSALCREWAEDVGTKDGDDDE